MSNKNVFSQTGSYKGRVVDAQPASSKQGKKDKSHKSGMWEALTIPILIFTFLIVGFILWVFKWMYDNAHVVWPYVVGILLSLAVVGGIVLLCVSSTMIAWALSKWQDYTGKRDEHVLNRQIVAVLAQATDNKANIRVERVNNALSFEAIHFLKEAQATNYYYGQDEEDDTDLEKLPEKAASLSPDVSVCLSSEFSAHADDILSGRGGIFGVSGSGKSNTIAVTCEELGRLGVPLVLADTEDEYASLADPQWLPMGKRAGANSGLIVATQEDAYRFGRYVLDKRLQVVLNLASYETDDLAAQIMIGIITGLKDWEEERESAHRLSCMFILDEAALWLPQQTRESRLSDETLASLQASFFADLVRRGRKRGMGLTLATQRIAEIDKRALQSNWKILHRQTEDTDLKRYEAMGVTRQETLTLQDGEAFVFTSQVSKQRIQLRRRYSTHGASTPGIASVRRHQSLDIHAEISDEIFAPGENSRNTFVSGIERMEDLSENPKIVIDASPERQKTVPEDIRKKIEQCVHRGMRRTQIQAYLQLNGDEYWMIKTVCDELEKER